MSCLHSSISVNVVTWCIMFLVEFIGLNTSELAHQQLHTIFKRRIPRVLELRLFTTISYLLGWQMFCD